MTGTRRAGTGSLTSSDVPSRSLHPKAHGTFQRLARLEHSHAGVLDAAGHEVEAVGDVARRLDAEVGAALRHVDDQVAEDRVGLDDEAHPFVRAGAARRPPPRPPPPQRGKLCWSWSSLTWGRRRKPHSTGTGSSRRGMLVSSGI